MVRYLIHCEDIEKCILPTKGLRNPVRSRSVISWTFIRLDAPSQSFYTSHVLPTSPEHLEHLGSFFNMFYISFFFHPGTPTRHREQKRRKGDGIPDTRILLLLLLRFTSLPLPPPFFLQNLSTGTKSFPGTATAGAGAARIPDRPCCWKIQ